MRLCYIRETLRLCHIRATRRLCSFERLCDCALERLYRLFTLERSSTVFIRETVRRYIRETLRLCYIRATRRLCYSRTVRRYIRETIDCVTLERLFDCVTFENVRRYIRELFDCVTLERLVDCVALVRLDANYRFTLASSYIRETLRLCYKHWDANYCFIRERLCYISRKVLH